MATSANGLKKVGAYITLMKPGIIIGNLITAMAGFFLAARGDVSYLLLVKMLLGLFCIVGSACVINNLRDITLDQKMERTALRPLVKKRISVKEGWIFAAVLWGIGSLILKLTAYPMTLFFAWIGFGMYTLIYTPLKLKNRYATEIGSLAGSMPPLVGYSAVMGEASLAGWILALTVALWQMPHFFAITLYRLKDYKKGGVPVLPVVSSVRQTKLMILVYIFLFTFMSLLLYGLGYVGLLYGIGMGVFNGLWIALAVKGLFIEEYERWAKTIFLFSLIVILALTLAIMGSF